MDFLDRQTSFRPSFFLVLMLLPAVYGPGFWPWSAAGLVAVAAGGWLIGHRRTGRFVTTAIVGVGLSLVWGVRTMPEPGPLWPFAVQGEAAGRGTVSPR